MVGFVLLVSIWIMLGTMLLVGTISFLGVGFFRLEHLSVADFVSYAEVTHLVKNACVDGAVVIYSNSEDFDRVGSASTLSIGLLKAMLRKMEFHLYSGSLEKSL